MFSLHTKRCMCVLVHRCVEEHLFKTDSPGQVHRERGGAERFREALVRWWGCLGGEGISKRPQALRQRACFLA